MPVVSTDSTIKPGQASAPSLGPPPRRAADASTVTPHRPTGHPAQTAGRPQEGRPDAAVRLHGRDAALAVVHSALEGAAAGRGSTVVARGGSGSGKSALLHWTACTATGAGWHVLHVSGDRKLEARPFAAIRSLVPFLDAPAGGLPRRAPPWYTH